MIDDSELWNQLDENDIFEYVRDIGNEYYPDYYDRPTVLPANLPPIEAIANDEIPPVDCKEYAGIGFDGFSIFRDIQTGKKEFLFRKEDYLADIDIQLTLKLIGLDPEKFWQVLLFIHYMAERNNTDCHPLSPSLHDHISNLCEALMESKTIISIKRPGLKPYVIANPDTKAFIANLLDFYDRKYTELNYPAYTGRMYNLKSDIKDLGLRWQIYDEYEAFQLIFRKHCTDKDLPKRIAGQKGSRDKDLFVSRLLFMTRLVDDKRFRESRDPLRSIIHSCKKSKRPMLTASLE